MDQNMQIESIQSDSVQAEKSEPKNDKLKKSLMATIGILIATIGIFSAQTYAYFVDSTTSQDNRIQTGTLKVELVEMQDEGQTELAVTPARMMPGMSARRVVSAKNTGTLPVYVRIKVEKTILQSENAIPDGWEQLISCNFMADDESTPEISEGLWRYRDGYYYYIIAVSPGSTTATLFDTVSFSPDMGNEFKNSQIQLKVICQTVQSGGNSDSPFTAWGWPDEPAASE